MFPHHDAHGVPASQYDIGMGALTYI